MAQGSPDERGADRLHGVPAPLISVVIPSYNAARTISACLDALLGQATDVPYEIIVADSSGDDTPAIVARYAPRVRLVRSAAQLNPGPARNLGIRHARGPILAFTDTDCVVSPGWIAAIAAAHADHDAIGGRILNGTPRSIVGTALYLCEFVEFSATGRRRYASIPSCNVSYKRSLLEQRGGFPETFWAEEFILNTGIAGGLHFSPAMVVHHLNRTGLRETVRHARKVGLGAALGRRVTGQVGFLFRFPALVPLLWGYRFLRIASLSARSGQFFDFLRATPILMIHLAAWTSGFLAGTRPPAGAAAGPCATP